MSDARATTEELLIERLRAGRLNSRADLQEAERAARELGLRRLARHASKERRKLAGARRPQAPAPPATRR